MRERVIVRSFSVGHFADVLRPATEGVLSRPAALPGQLGPFNPANPFRHVRTSPCRPVSIVPNVQIDPFRPANPILNLRTHAFRPVSTILKARTTSYRPVRPILDARTDAFRPANTVLTEQNQVFTHKWPKIMEKSPVSSLLFPNPTIQLKQKD